ncbi:MAG TPA: MFS transporter [Dongiaceae bacterium]|jgi:MFS family permease|nr:MFS transporter [Dongiaceae bacterium]
MEQKARWSDVLAGEYGWLTILLNLGIVIHAIDVLILTTILPSMVRDIGGAHYYTWSTMLYMVSSIVGATSVGFFRHFLGLRRCYVIGTLAFLTGSVGCAVAPIMAVLLVMRFVQGFGGGVIIALSIGLIGEYFPEYLKKRVLASISASWGLAALLGPAIGGFFADTLSWRGAFWINVPILGVMLLLAFRLLPQENRSQNIVEVPWVRLGFLSFGVLLLGSADQDNPVLLRAFLVGSAIFCLVAMMRLDDRATRRLFPAGAFSLATMRGAAYGVMFLSSIIHTVIGIFLPLAMQKVYGQSALISGYVAATLALFWTLASVGTSGIHGTLARRLIPIGLSLCVLGSLCLTIGAIHIPWEFLPFLSGLVGFGLGCSNLHLTEEVMRATPQAEIGLTASSMPTIRNLGIAFGSALAGIVANASGLTDQLTPLDVARATHWVLGLGMAAAILAVLLSVRFMALLSRPAPQGN